MSINITESQLRRTVWDSLYTIIGRNDDRPEAPSSLRLDVMPSSDGRWFWFLSGSGRDDNGEIIAASFAERDLFSEWGDSVPFPNQWAPSTAADGSAAPSFASVGECLEDANLALARMDVDIDADGYATIAGERVQSR